MAESLLGYREKTWQNFGSRLEIVPISRFEPCRTDRAGLVIPKALLARLRGNLASAAYGIRLTRIASVGRLGFAEPLLLG